MEWTGWQTLKARESYCKLIRDLIWSQFFRSKTLKITYQKWTFLTASIVHTVLKIAFPLEVFRQRSWINATLYQSNQISIKSFSIYSFENALITKCLDKKSFEAKRNIKKPWKALKNLHDENWCEDYFETCFKNCQPLELLWKLLRKLPW